MNNQDPNINNLQVNSEQNSSEILDTGNVVNGASNVVVENNTNTQVTDVGLKKKSKFSKIIIIIICLIILGIGAFFVWDKFLKKNNTSTGSDSEQVENKSDDNINDEKEKEEEQEYSIVVYKSKDGYCVEKSSICNEGSIEIPVKHEDAKLYNVINLDKHYAIYVDNYVYLYDIDDEESKKLNIEAKDYNMFDFVANYNTEKIIGIFCGNVEDEDTQNYNKSAFYNINTEKLLYEGKYYAFDIAGNGYLNATLKTGDGEDNDDYTQYLLNQNKEEVLLSKVGQCVNYRVEKNSNDYIIVESEGCIGLSSSTVYTKGKKVIFRDVSDELWDIDDDGNIFVADDSIAKEYNFSGITLKTSRDLNNILHIIMNYAIIINSDNELMIVNLDSSKEYKLMDWKEEYYYHSMISGYYEMNALENENEKAPGIYLIVGYGNGDVDKDESGIEFYFDPKTNDIKSYDLEQIGGYAKPVLYLYPSKETKVTVNFENEDSLTTTYPKFNEEWKVTAYPNGDLYDENGKYYYGLYWEENLNHFVNFDTGFYVTKDNAIEFLEDKLKYIGLNDREMNEFIMYWLPILEKNGQSLVYFELTSERDINNKLIVSPQPDSLLRIAIHVKKVDEYVNIKEEKLTHFERIGFSAIEWGGVVYN